MHVLFLHSNCPAQFGPFLSRLGTLPGWRATFVSRTGKDLPASVEHLLYHPASGATANTHYNSRSFENATWHSHAVATALSARPDLRPDLIVAHSGFLTALPLRELYPHTPVLNYFEFFYHAVGSDIDFRPEWPPTPAERTRARYRNATILLDLNNCQAGYSPTPWQRSLLPVHFQTKVRVAFDGVDTELWSPRSEKNQHQPTFRVPPGTKVVTYVARGFESMRGFDIFMKMARELASRRSDVRFVVVGEDRICYGGDATRTGGKTFKQWVLSQGDYDLSRFAFLGRLPAESLAAIFRMSDLHVYLTAPFVLSWSLVNAMACGTPILASDTAPVRDAIVSGKSGLLTDFFDVPQMVEVADRLLSKPDEARALGVAAAEQVRENYSLDVCFPRLVRLYEETANLVLPRPNAIP